MSDKGKESCFQEWKIERERPTELQEERTKRVSSALGKQLLQEEREDGSGNLRGKTRT